MPLHDVLAKMEQEGKFYFSYNSDIINGSQKVTIDKQQQSIENILNELLGDQYKYQVMDNHIIIKTAISQGIIVTGRLVEAESGLPIEFASIYEKSVLSGTMSDANGNFKLHIRQPLANYELVISKLSYEDTVLKVTKSFNGKAPITLKKTFYTLDSVDVVGIQNHWLASRLLSTKTKVNSVNLNSFFGKQPFQFSVLPGISSKSRLNSQIVNKFSFNLLGGYSAGVDGFEFGTVFNIVQKDMRYVQLSGLFNIVGRDMEGVQIAGVYNYVKREVKGVQVSGVFNAAHAAVTGVQASGFANWNEGDIRGIQFTGVLNKSNRVKGIQASGFANWNKKDMNGVQFAGVLNKNEQISGTQFAGFANYTSGNTEGAQIAGAVNYTRNKMQGSQIASLFNYARVIAGTQIGVVNIADSSEGLSIGFINIILKGKHSFNINTNEWQSLSASYKSGSDRLYNIFQIGGTLRANHKLLSIGYGFGNESRIGKKSALLNELIIHTVYAGNWNDQNILTRYQLMYQYKLRPKFKLYAGPAFSLLVFENKNTYSGFGRIQETNYPSFNLGNRVNCWLGWTVGVSIF
ncbi:STN and carboxypeptidase regulatory-like domain-containing protein [Taibaiella sp. KBW10]|uniref:STN and carboxypeptidase regulatory-like domain-containing protein n=1 Tax=Taibaiella sp. KBW10 TaxID=2153357 RepID=UPI0013157AAD|nr:STN and carboxypeptidase regulatory-like domain-containing protein [Taibaiella sp. KBW10]